MAIQKHPTDDQRFFVQIGDAAPSNEAWDAWLTGKGFTELSYEEITSLEASSPEAAAAYEQRIDLLKDELVQALIEKALAATDEIQWLRARGYPFALHRVDTYPDGRGWQEISIPDRQHAVAFALQAEAAPTR